MGRPKYTLRRNGETLVKFGAYVTVQREGRDDSVVNDIKEVSFFASPVLEHSTSELYDFAESVARKKWKKFHVTETWRY